MAAAIGVFWADFRLMRGCIHDFGKGMVEDDMGMYRVCKFCGQREYTTTMDSYDEAN
jgi:hypothetical protein